MTLAVLATKLDYLIEQVREMCQRFDSHEARIDQLERGQIQTNDTLAQFKRALAWGAGIVASVVAAVIIALVLQRIGA